MLNFEPNFLKICSATTYDFMFEILLEKACFFIYKSID